MLNILNLIDEAKCYEMVRNLRWPNGCDHFWVKKRGFHNSSKHRQRCVCKAWDRQFGDLTNTIFARHHQPLHVWMLCLYLMDLNLLNRQIAAKLGVNKDDQKVIEQLRSDIVEKKRRHPE